MARFWTSDTHFGHKNIIKYAERPFSDFASMDEALVERWNAVVGPTDVVYHLGDAAMGDSSRWDDIFKSLNGYKHLVVGNHDRIFAGEKPRQREKWDEKYHEWFDEVSDSIRGFWLDDGTIVDMSHFPYDGDSHGGDRYSEYRLPDRGRTLLHGHTHAQYASDGIDARLSRSKRGSIQVHVGVDAWHYRPVSEDQIINLIEIATERYYMKTHFNRFCLNPIKRMANTPRLLLVGVLVTLVVAALGFAIIEGVGPLDSLYWASTALTSVGYGDLSPVTAGGKILTIVFQLWSLFILLPCAVANIIDSVRVDEHKMTHSEQEWLFSALEEIGRKNNAPLPPQPHPYE